MGLLHDRRKSRLLPLLAVGFFALAIGPIAAVGGTPFRTFHVVRQPVTVGLPAGWFAVAPSAPTVFVAYDPLERAYVSLQAGPSISSDFETVAKAFDENVRQYDLTQDPTATIRHRRVTLPAGKAEEVISRLHSSTNGRSVLMASYGYVLLHLGRVYGFTYVCPATKVGTYLATFDRSAHSIRFTR